VVRRAVLATESESSAVQKLDCLLVNMRPRLAAQMRQLAEANGRTLEQEIREALREHVDRAGDLLHSPFSEQ
jgi:hypothetical protein